MAGQQNDNTGSGDFPGSAGDSYRTALQNVVKQEHSGHTVSGDDPNWAKVYNHMARDADSNPQKSAERALETLPSLKPGTEEYNATWNLFHEDVARLDQSGHTARSTALLAKAVAPSSEQDGLMRGKNDSETLNNVTNMSDEELSHLSQKQRDKISDEFAAAYDSISPASSFPKIQEKMDRYKEQAIRLINENISQHDDTQPSAYYAVPEVWADHNMKEYLGHQDNLSKKDLPGSTQSLAGVLADPNVRDSKWGDTLWAQYNQQIDQLSNSPDNKQKNIEAANRAMDTVYKSLPEGDPRRAELEDKAAQNGFNIKEGKEYRRDPAHDATHSGKLEENGPVSPDKLAGLSGMPRFEVSDAHTISAPLPVVAQDTGISRGGRDFA